MKKTEVTEFIRRATEKGTLSPFQEIDRFLLAWVPNLRGIPTCKGLS
jgi:hypothetical protein